MGYRGRSQAKHSVKRKKSTGWVGKVKNWYRVDYDAFRKMKGIDYIPTYLRKKKEALTG